MRLIGGDENSGAGRDLVYLLLVPFNGMGIHVGARFVQKEKITGRKDRESYF